MEQTKTLSPHGSTESAPSIHRLPTELLQHLLSLAVADIRQGSQPWRVYSRVTELKLVCTCWMTAIDSYPSFWTLLTNRLSPLVVPIVLQKSGRLPLDIDLVRTKHSSIATLFGYMNTVVNLADRWQLLNIEWFPDYEEDKEALLNLLLTPAPKLKELRFSGFSDTVNTANLFDGVAPNLDTITTAFTVPNWTSFVMKGLRKLAVGAVTVGRRDFESFAQALVASPNMEELQICEWMKGPGGLPEEYPIKLQPITFNFLRSFVLTSGTRVRLIISTNLLHPPNSPQDILTSALKLADELLPSVHRATLLGIELQRVMEYVTLSAFPNLAHLEVHGIQRASWEEMLTFVSARSELAAAPDSKIKALQSISLPRDSIDEEGVKKLSRVVERVRLS
ncbi:hypothetical protein FRC00_000911 [Tulasnella sp. 408]|nr:hypothetical protein FRC00_000911 [Tulasnella sp. 408]